VKEPVTYFSAGLRYPLATQGKFVPYALAGFGVGQVKKDVTYTISGGNPNDYVTLGDDLSGTSTNSLLNIGAVVACAAYAQLTDDFQFRLMHVFTEGEAMNIGRAGVGVGVRF